MGQGCQQTTQLAGQLNGLRQLKEYLKNIRLLKEAPGSNMSHSLRISRSVSLGSCSGAPTSA